MHRISPVILCGGSGTRLWPLSRKSFPKQFVPLVEGRSLLSMTLERMSRNWRAPTLVAAEDHRFLALDSLEEAGFKATVLLEPGSRNTAAAMALAAIQACRDGRGLLLFCPADHHIPDVEAFRKMVESGVDAALQGSIVTFGVVPAFPSTAYGYIEKGDLRPGGGWLVRRFVEKPNQAQAQALLLSGAHFWNAGIFLCQTQAILDALREHAPDILVSCEAAMDGAQAELLPGDQTFIRPASQPFEACRSQSIDYAVLERHSNVVVMPFAGQWSDVGSWGAVADLVPADESMNRVHGKGVVHSCRNTFLHAPHRLVVALGVEDVVVVDTPDAVLVAHRDRAEQVKDVVGWLEQEQYAQAATHRKVARPWGWYDCLDAGDRFQVKRIGVKPGAALSLQMHHHRAEHWIVVKGVAEVTCGSRTFTMGANESTYISKGEIHRLRNIGDIELEVIEVQSGTYLGEDDIVRFEDNYGRTQAGA